MPRPKDPWIADEPRLVAVVIAVTLRALRRPILVFGLAILATLLVVSTLLRRAPSYEATLYFHMSEGNVQLSNAPRPVRRVREYIADVVLNRRQLLDVMGKFGLYSRLLKADPQAAIASMRDDIEISVEHNDFIWDRGPHDPPRAADITLSYRSGDAQRARAVVHELGDAVLRAQSDARSERLRLSRTAIVAERDHAQAELRTRQEELDRLWLDAGRMKDEHALVVRVQIGEVQEEMKSAAGRVQQLDQRLADYEFAQRAESEQAGLQLVLLDEDLAVLAQPLTTFKLVVVAIAMLGMALVVFVGVVGGFDNRIYRGSDLEAQGVPVFGEVARFGGDDRGSYRARTRRHWRKRV